MRKSQLPPHGLARTLVTTARSATVVAATLTFAFAGLFGFAHADDGEDCEVCPCRFVPPDSRGENFETLSTCIEYEDKVQQECVDIQYVFRCIDGFTTPSTTQTTTATTTAAVQYCGPGQRRSASDSMCKPCRPIRADKAGLPIICRDPKYVEDEMCQPDSMYVLDFFCTTVQICPISCNEACRQNTYQDEVQHRDTECKYQPPITCSKDEYVADSDSLFVAQSCRPCPASMHLPEATHSETMCIDKTTTTSTSTSTSTSTTRTRTSSTATTTTTATATTSTTTATVTTTTTTTTTSFTTTTTQSTTTTTIRCEYCINAEGGDCIDPVTRMCAPYLDPSKETCFDGFVGNCLATTPSSTASSTPTTLSSTPASTATSTATSAATNTATTLTSTPTSTGTTSGTTATSTGTRTAVSTQTSTAVTSAASTATTSATATPATTPTTVTTTATTTAETTATTTPRTTSPSTTQTSTQSATAMTSATTSPASTETTTAVSTATTTVIGCTRHFEYGNDVAPHNCMGPRHAVAGNNTGNGDAFTSSDVGRFCWRSANDEWSNSFDLEIPAITPPLQTAPGQMYKLVGVTGGGKLAEIRIVYGDGSNDDADDDDDDRRQYDDDDDDDALSGVLGRRLYEVELTTLLREPPNNWPREQMDAIKRNLGTILSSSVNRHWGDTIEAGKRNGRTQLLSTGDLIIASLDEYTGCFVAEYVPGINGPTHESRCSQRDELQSALESTAQSLRATRLQFVHSGSSVSLAQVTTTTPPSTSRAVPMVTETAVAPEADDSEDPKSLETNAAGSMTTSVLIAAIVVIVLVVGFVIVRSNQNDKRAEEIRLANIQKAKEIKAAKKGQKGKTKKKATTKAAAENADRPHKSLQNKPVRSSVRNPTLPRPEKKKKGVRFNAKMTETLGNTSIFGNEGSYIQSKVMPNVPRVGNSGSEKPFKIVTLLGTAINGYDPIEDLGETSF